MLSPQVWSALRWQPANADYDGAVLVGGLENELRHFGDPDEEHDVWTDPAPIRPFPYAHEGTRAVAAAGKNEKQEKLKSNHRVSILGTSNSKLNTIHESPHEASAEDDGRINPEEEDGCTIESYGEPLEFHDNWFKEDTPKEDEECEVGSQNCAQCGRVSKERTVDDSESTNSCEQDFEKEPAASIKGSDTCGDQEDMDDGLDFEESLILMFNEELHAKGDTEEAKNTIASIQPSKGNCFCRCGESEFVDIDDTSTINGLNGIAAAPCPAQAIIAAQPGLWRAMSSCRPLKQARRPHTGSWQAV
ncbi:hypothetical protein DSL72_005546 [Monilinia vaccinii-corymbosi]|uniref:Uncharacterized protein n=1 Tax=Monilinia vaccinii-corymbosi TaxID=61207 RepID=A0A8A3PG15_9HELO|nr:hypothetical protein DSL72_005546 [Monilinia vaccinii-corymbosi]